MPSPHLLPAPPEPLVRPGGSFAGLLAVAPEDPDVHVVLVVGDRLHHVRRPGEAALEADEDVFRSGVDEEVDQRLCQPAIDMARRARFSFPSVPARVVDVDVEAVLV